MKNPRKRERVLLLIMQDTAVLAASEFSCLNIQTFVSLIYIFCFDELIAELQKIEEKSEMQKEADVSVFVDDILICLNLLEIGMKLKQAILAALNLHL